MSGPDGWDVAGIRARCERARDVLSRKQVASAEELADYWPGGAENTDPDPLGQWVYCFANYTRFLGRMAPEAEARRREAGEAALLAALREDAVTVDLVRPIGDRATVAVYPKSEHALSHLAARDLELGRLVGAWQYLTTEAGPQEVAEQARLVAAEMAYQNRVMVWAVTHAGSGLPWLVEADAPEPPAWLLALDPADTLRILRAHQEVNGRRIALLSERMGRGRGTGHGWATLAATAASELGVSSRSLLRDTSLAGWLAQLLITADAKREAAETARAESEAKRGAR